MSFHNVSGVLLDPTGEYSVGDKVKFTHQSTTGQTIRSAIKVFVVPPDGSYSLDIEWGNILVEYQDIKVGCYTKIGIVTVNADTTATTLPELLNAIVPPTDEQLLEFQQALEYAYQWARQDEDVLVDDTIHTPDYSAYNYAQKAAASASEATGVVLTPTESVMDAIRAGNKDQFAASGFVNNGKHGTISVNEGLWVDETTPNTLFIGGGANGTSETDFSVTHIAGFTGEQIGVNSAVDNIAVKFPEAPNGTVIYDSTGDARGTGNANLNLATEIDPKYGDIAADTNEAAARAFEGQVKNGDFRLGDSGDWEVTTGELNIADGKAHVQVTNAWATLRGVNNVQGQVNGDVWRVTAVIEEATSSVSDAQVWSIGINGLDFIATTNSINLSTYPLTVTADITVTTDTNTAAPYMGIRSTNDHDFTVLSLTAHKVTEEVVTDRVDMFGGEFFLEEVSQTNPYVYDQGMIQSKATDINGVITSATNRPDTYCAVYDGDTGSSGLGVDWFAASDADKQAILAADGINIYRLNDGRIVQWRMRQRTVAGAGNGDWARTSPAHSGGALQYASPEWVQVQGVLDSLTGDTSYTRNSNRIFLTNMHDSRTVNDPVIFESNRSGASVNGECYFHVWGTVPRLNQGAYHPSLNAMGSSRFMRITTGLNGDLWTSSNIGEITNTATCLNPVEDGVTGVSGYRPVTGVIGSNSGRDDEKFYDAIYPSGQGGVIDDRLSAWEFGLEDKSKAEDKLKNGVLRGMQKMVWTQVFASTGDVPSGWEIVNDDNAAAVVALTLTNTSVEGNATNGFTVQDVLGDPANIIQTDALKGGWLGYWVPVLSAASTDYPLTRKRLETDDIILTTYNLTSEAWTTPTRSFDATTNTVNALNTSNYIQIAPYQAAPYVTEQDSNRPVLWGEAGLGDVWATSHWSPIHGTLLHESLLGKVGTTTNTTRVNQMSLLTTGLNRAPGSGTLTESATFGSNSHSSITLSAPNNDGGAVKAITYATSENQQVSLNAAYNELVYNSGGTVGNEWGDTVEATDYVNAYGAITIIDGQGTYTNLNGDTCLAGSNRTTKPLGWTKNKASVGTQTPGVDL